MSLFSDIKGDLAENWKNSGWALRIILVFSLFFTVSSITSLSDVVFKWKGLIYTALEFYRAWVHGPINDIAKMLGIVVLDWVVGVTIISSLWMGSCVRAIAILRKSPLQPQWSFPVVAGLGVLAPTTALLYSITSRFRS